MIVHSPKELAEFIRDRRKRKKISQAEVGDRVGIKQATISSFENNPEGTIPKEESHKSKQEWQEEW
jgi:HTH-type transcriptional regulator/antitoxin HipB